MSKTDNHFNPAAEEQAALWAARLDGASASGVDRPALNAWLAENPAHRELLAAYCQLSADLEAKLPVLAAAALGDLPSTPAQHSHRGKWFAAIGLAAAAALAVVLWTRSNSTPPAENMVTAVAQRSSFTLSDGSHVDLNAQTSLRFDLDNHRRHVLLASGEAYFDVQKDPSRPFIVETPAGSVRVTGTHFNVRVDSASSLEVTVSEGSVQAHPADAAGASSSPHSLTSGDQLTATGGAVTVRQLSPTALDDVLAWRQGQVVFDGTPLNEALARFARYHGRGITVSRDAAGKRVGGRYSLDDLDGFLSFIEEGLQVHVTRELNGTLQVSARAPR
jgi:transmembrane sensor